MSTFVIEGGHRLKGEITPQGAKNEALQVICATLLSKEAVRIQNIPNILDVNNLIVLLEQMGVSTQWNGKGDCTFCAENINLDYLSSQEFWSVVHACVVPCCLLVRSQHALALQQ